jgi:hypothetical protein
MVLNKEGQNDSNEQAPALIFSKALVYDFPQWDSYCTVDKLFGEVF